jgi:hypothetical protein
MRYATLDVGNLPAGIALVPKAIELLGRPAELHNEVPDRSSGSTSPRFSRHRRIRAASSLPMMILASEPPMNSRRFVLIGREVISLAFYLFKMI